MIKHYAELIAHKLSWLPDVVSYVWLFLIGLMFITLYLVQKKPHGISIEAFWVLILILATITYPLYSLGYQLIPGFLGNIAYIILLSFVIYKVYQKLPVGALLLSPIVIWVTIACTYSFAKIICKYY